MMNHRRKMQGHSALHLGLGALAALAILLSACTDPTIAPSIVVEFIATGTTAPDTATPGPSVTPSPVPPTATPLPTATPIPPKPIIVALNDEPESLHPLYATSRAAQTVLGALFVGCIGQDENGAPVALGCESVPTLENGGAVFAGEGDERQLQVTFKIRAGWRWTDGTPVTAQDAIYTWQLIMSPEAQLRDALTQKVYGMTAPDERTIIVSFMSAGQARLAAARQLRGDVAFEYFGQRGDYAAYAEQAAPLADSMYWAVVRWLPSHLLRDVPPVDQATSEYASKPIGDGAFEIEVMNKGSDLTLKRSALPFPLQAQGNAPGIIFKFVQHDSNVGQLMLDGQAQIALPMTSAASGTYTPVVAPVMEQIVFNTARFPFDDVKVRQAVRYALDAAEIISDPLTGPATEAHIIDPVSALYGVNGAALRQTFDPVKARALLAEAGYDCGTVPCARNITQNDGAVVSQTLQFTLVTNERTPRNAISQVIQKQLSAAGFAVDVQIMHGLGKASRLFAPFEQGGVLLTRNFDAALYQAPALTRLTGVFNCASIPSAQNPAPTQGNVFGLCDTALDALIVAAEGGETTISSAGRAKGYVDALQAIADSAVFVPLYSPVWVLPARDVGGLRFNGSGVLTWNAWEWVQLGQP